MKTDPVIIRFKNRQPIPDMVKIGTVGDHNVESIQIVPPTIAAAQKAFLCVVMRGKWANAVSIPDDGVIVIDRNFTAYPGTYRAWVEVEGTSDEAVWHSDTFGLVVQDIPQLGDELDDADPTFLQQMQAAINNVGTMRKDMGFLHNLITNDKSSFVAAVNEMYGIAGKPGPPRASRPGWPQGRHRPARPAGRTRFAR